MAVIDFGKDFIRNGMVFEIEKGTRFNKEKSIYGSSYPICALFDSKESFDSFGDEAKEKYSRLVIDKEHHDWYYFTRIKMFFDNTCLTKEILLEDETGKNMRAMKVFPSILGYLKDGILMTWNCVSDRQIANITENYKDLALNDVKESDIKWVITVPAIWNDPLIQLIKKATEKIGICGDKLKIVPQPEAAFLYFMCQTNDLKCESKSFEAGTKYMVVHAEDSTLEMIVYEVQHDGILRKLFKYNGDDWDGNKVDGSALNVVVDLVGNSVMEAFRSKFKDEYLDFCCNINEKVRSVSPEQTHVTLTIPLYLTETFTQMNSGSNFSAKINSEPNHKNMTFMSGKLKMGAHIFKSCFDESCNKIIYHMQELFRYPSLEDVSFIFLAGSLANTPMFQIAMKKAFQHQREVWVPDCDAELAVLKGAVLYGQQVKIKHKFKFVFT